MGSRLLESHCHRLCVVDLDSSTSDQKLSLASAVILYGGMHRVPRIPMQVVAFWRSRLHVQKEMSPGNEGRDRMDTRRAIGTGGSQVSNALFEPALAVNGEFRCSLKKLRPADYQIAFPSLWLLRLLLVDLPMSADSPFEVLVPRAQFRHSSLVHRRDPVRGLCVPFAYFAALR